MSEKGEEERAGKELDEEVGVGGAGGMEEDEEGDEKDANASSSRETRGTEDVETFMRGAGEDEGMPPAEEYEEGGA